MGVHLQLTPINCAKNFLALEVGSAPAPSAPPGYAYDRHTYMDVTKNNTSIARHS